MKQDTIKWPLLIACVISCMAISNGYTALAPGFIIAAKRFVNYGICIWLILATNWRREVDNAFPKVLTVAMWFLFRNFHVHTPGSIDLVVTISLIALLYTNESTLISVLKSFKVYLVITTALGFVSYVDAITGMHLPHTIVPFADVDDSMGIANNAFYLNHYFSYTLVQPDGPRLCTLFNEPGYYGTFVALILILDRINQKKYQNVILLIGGVLSMSMAFFLLLALGILMFSINSIRFKIGLVILILVIVFVLPKINFQSDIVNNLLQRFEFDFKTFTFVGDDREGESMKYLYNKFKQSDKILFGYGTGYCNTYMEGSCTYKKNIIEWGYLGFLLTYGFLMLSAFLDSKANKMAIAYSFCFLISIYQRPSVYTMAYFLILFGGILYIKNTQGNSVR